MYLALYRKYRPRTFDNVVSQDYITTTLKNQIKTGKIAHAYLFTGSRGTGKTSCAKIMAMAVNCLSPKDGNPCLECENCKEILSGAATDIVEMDAASNNSVDDVRILRDEAAYTPVSCKYRVYIIDEVHMLSPAAFNALLKTLEEPPPHVIFILATTELHKVPATILSRCQRFQFTRINPSVSAQHLIEVSVDEGLTLSEDAAALIARLSDGGMRDALSILDKCAAVNKNISTAVVRECAGVTDSSYLFQFSSMIADRNVSGCFKLLDKLHHDSKDLASVMEELASHFRDIMLIKSAPEDKSLISAMPEDYSSLESTAERFSLDEVLQYLTLLQQCSDNMNRIKQRRTAAEMCLLRLCSVNASSETQVKPVLKAPAPVPAVPAAAKKEESEEIYASPEFPPEPPPDENYIPYENTVPTVPAALSELSEKEPINSISGGEWISAIGKISQGLRYTYMLDNAEVRVPEKGRLEILTENRLLLQNAKNNSCHDLEQELEKVLGKKIVITVTDSSHASEPKPDDDSPINMLLDKARRLNIEIEYK